MGAIGGTAQDAGGTVIPLLRLAAGSDPSSHYSYDSNVANSRHVAVGDRLVFWDEVSLIGASTLASIDQRAGTKKISRCPECSTTNIAARKTKSPRFRCDDA